MLFACLFSYAMLFVLWHQIPADHCSPFLSHSIKHFFPASTLAAHCCKRHRLVMLRQAPAPLGGFAGAKSFKKWHIHGDTPATLATGK